MTRRIEQQQLRVRADIVATPALAGPRACTDHNFELPTGLYHAMGLLFAGAVGVLAMAFNSEMALSYGIVFAFLAAFFAIPAIFVKAAPHDGAKALRWHQFRDQGIATATGRTGAGEATTLVLILPALVLFWAIAVAVIAASV